MMDVVVDAEGDGVDEEMVSMMVKRLCLTTMFDAGTILAIDVQDHFVVKNVV